jgi:hypothetical protein
MIRRHAQKIRSDNRERTGRTAQALLMCSEKAGQLSR